MEKKYGLAGHHSPILHKNEPTMTEPVRGMVVKHFKGDVYLVHGVATHTERSEPLVIYERVEDRKLFARPFASWDEPAKMADGLITERFTHADGKLGVRPGYKSLHICDRSAHELVATVSDLLSEIQLSMIECNRMEHLEDALEFLVSGKMRDMLANIKKRAGF
jgi:hypothetical protein